MEDANRIAYITCVSDEEMYAACRQALARQQLPEGMEAEFVPIRGARSMCAGYQQGQERSRAKYKLYLHQDCILQRADAVRRMLRVFAHYPKAGLVGLAGARKLPEYGMWWLGEDLYYHLAEQTGDTVQLHAAGTTAGAEALEVAAVDGVLMLTAVDIPWRADIFTGWHFYDISMCLEMRWRGYEVYVPDQEQMRPWVLHRTRNRQLPEDYFAWMQTFLDHYGQKDAELAMFSVDHEASLRPRLSVCYIVRDEARELALSLARLQGEADEIIVVDTGSADDTAEAARSFGAWVYAYAWDDDFAAARNLALEKATGDWILVLDADEHLPVLHGSLHHSIARAAAGGAEALAVTLVNVDLDAGGRETPPEPLLRLWRSRPGRRYTGRVHEAIGDHGAPLAPLGEAREIVLRHTGYSEARAKEKMARNLALLQRQIEERGEQNTDWCYLADCCYGLEEYELALHYARLAIEKGARTLAGPARMYEVAIASLAKLDRPTSERLALARQAAAACPDQASFAREAESAAARCEAEEWYAAQAEGDAAALSAAAADWIAAADAPSTRRSFLAAWAGETGRVRLSMALDAARRGPVSRLVAEMTAGTALDAAPIARQASQGICDLFLALYLLSATREGQRQLLAEAWPERLPAPFTRLICALCLLDHEDRAEGSPSLTAADFEAWSLGLGMIARAAASAGLTRYARLALDFAPDWACVTRAADALLARRDWRDALLLLSAVPAEAADGDGGHFWYATGRALYHLGERGAAECFARAAAAGCAERSLPSYQAWSEEAEHGTEA